MSHIRHLSLLLWLLALGLVGWTLSQLPLAQMADSIRALNRQQVLFWVGLNLLIIVLSTQRWRGLNTMLGAAVPFLPLALIRQAGQTVSFITPGPQFGGEPLQIYWLYKRCAVPIHKAVLSLGLDRFYELWINFSVLLLGALLLLAAPGAADPQWHSIVLALAVLVLMLPLLGWSILRRPQWLTQRLSRVTGRWHQHPRLQQIDGHWQALGSDLQQAMKTQKRALTSALLLSLLTWVGILVELGLTLSFLDIQVDLQGFVLIMLAMRLAMLLPLPGGIGTIEASVLWSFQMLALPASAAIGLIALMRLRDATVLVAGLLCLKLMQTKE